MHHLMTSWCCDVMRSDIRIFHRDESNSVGHMAHASVILSAFGRNVALSGHHTASQCGTLQRLPEAKSILYLCLMCNNRKIPFKMTSVYLFIRVFLLICGVLTFLDLSVNIMQCFDSSVLYYVVFGVVFLYYMVFWLLYIRLFKYFIV